MNSPILAQIDKTHLIDCLQSDFLQASELEVLQAVLNWAECKVMKRMEDKGKLLYFRTHLFETTLFLLMINSD